MASKVELSLMWGCNRKTATRIIREFNQMGILRSEPSNRTTIHTLLCLSVWFTAVVSVRLVHGSADNQESFLCQQPYGQAHREANKTD